MRPDDGFVGEEGSDLAGSTGVVWIADPIDGTVNYLYGLPHFAVSLAAEVDGEVVAGVVAAPALGLEYVATRGGGATCNGAPVRTRPVPPMAERLVATGFSYEQPARARQASYISRLLPQIRDLRRLGSCALDLCGVASGTLDAYVEEGAHIWDHAAAGLVVAEAGGILEVTRSTAGKRVLICAPQGGFDDFRAAVVEAGFVGGEGPNRDLLQGE
jgi:myo-inositol-1(or 4)-monophosphatase